MAPIISGEKLLLVGIAIIFFLPTSASAAVVINEVAWMGTEVSANDEWIELYNNGTAGVNVDGWIITDTISLEIPLVGSIAAGEHAVLERTDDSSAPGSAFLIYVGALSNDGRILTLQRNDGSIEDQVSGGENWENIGGNNTTKDTPQLTPNGWITAPATPGSVNAQIDTAVVENESDTNVINEENEVAFKKSTRNSSNKSKVILKVPDTELHISIEAPNIAYVNQEVSFDVSAGGIGPHLINSLTYMWNFGDAYTKEVKSPAHTFSYPGTYVVIVNAEFALRSAIARHEITVLPVSFSIARTQRGDIQIHNNAKYEVDMSGYTLVGDTQFKIPKYTILLPQNTLTFPRNYVESGTQKMIALYDAEKIMVTSHLPQSTNFDFLNTATTKKEMFVTNAVSATNSQPKVTKLSKDNFNLVKENVSINKEIDKGAVPSVPMVLAPKSKQSAAVSEAGGVTPNTMLPYIGLVALVVLGGLTIFTNRKVSTVDEHT